MSYLSSKSNRTPLSNDYVYGMSNDGSTDGKILLSDITEIPETTRTINFNSSQTAAQIQAEIDAVGRYIPLDVNITFQFANGTYNLDSTLFFDGFHGAGNIFIYGDTTQTDGLHTNHNVHLDFSGDSCRGIYCIHNSTVLYIWHLKVTCDDGYECIIMQREGISDVRYNYVINTAKTSSSSRGIQSFDNHNSMLVNNYFDNNYYGIAVFEGGRIYSNGNDDTGTQPTYGLRAGTSGVIGKNGVQPAGSTGNELANTGGKIR